MSLKEQQSLLATHLETLSGIPSAIDYPDSQFTPPDDGSTFLRVRFIPSQPRRIGLTPTSINTSEYSILVMAPAKRTQSDALLAEAIRDHFPADLIFEGTGENTRVQVEPTIWQGYDDTKRARWVIPVSVYLETLKT